MKYLMIVLMLYSFTLSAQDVEKELKTDIKDVTVFLNSAQVTRTGSTQLPKGKINVTIKSLSPYIDENSVQVNAKGDFTLLSVNYHLNYLKEAESTSQIKDLVKKINAIDDSLAVNKAKLEVNKETIDLLDKNKKIGNENSGTDINQLKLAVRYFEQQMISIKEDDIMLAKKNKDLEDLKTRLNKQLSELNSRQNQPTGEIVIEVQSGKTADAFFTVTYQAGNAGWNPAYDLRATDISSPVELQYFATVYQNTGEDWNNVNIGFSNANPNQSGQAPDLSPWYLDFAHVYTFRKEAGKAAATMAQPATLDMPAEMDVARNARTMEVNVQENQTSFSFRVSQPYTVKNNVSDLKIALAKYKIPATYRYHVIPKLDEDAFLIADITGWDQYNLLRGQANLYFENTFVGRSTIDPAVQSDTMEISLGRDKSIIVKRTKIDTYTQKKFIGTNKIETRGFDISLRNNKSKAIDLVVEDQVPVSTRSEITVNATDVGGADYNKTNGKLTWKLRLDPQQQKDLKFQYEVRYPKNQRVILE